MAKTTRVMIVSFKYVETTLKMRKMFTYPDRRFPTNPLKFETILDPRPLPVMHMRRRCSALSVAYALCEKPLVFSSWFIFCDRVEIEEIASIARVLSCESCSLKDLWCDEFIHLLSCMKFILSHLRRWLHLVRE